VCSGCGQAAKEIEEVYEREVRDLPCFEYGTTVVIELYRVRCPECGIKAEKVPQLPSKARFSKRFEEPVGQACESARYGESPGSLPGLPVRCGPWACGIWNAGPKVDDGRRCGVDEIYLGKEQKFLTVVTNLETGEPLWFGRGRKKKTLDEFFEKHRDSGGLRRHRGTVPAKPGTVGAGVPDRI